MEIDILNYAKEMHCQELHMIVDEETGLQGIIAIHNTQLGPALGGCRCIPYPSTEAAVVDAIRLAQGMTFKAAVTNLPLGGGKSVLMKPDHIQDRVAYFKAVGRFIDSLNGRYITAVDSGTSPEDMDIIATETKHVLTTTHGVFSIADPSSLTAYGVMRGIEAAIKYRFDKNSLEGIHVAIQGLGHVGYSLASQLHAAGAKLTVYDINQRAVENAIIEFQASKAKSLEEIIKLKCDVFAPCALGGIINEKTIEELRAPIIAGCANNQLADPRNGITLAKKGILYAPDYVINAGALIYVAAEYSHSTEKEAKIQIDSIYDALTEIFTRASQENRSTSEIAYIIAMERLRKSSHDKIMESS